MQRGQVLAGLDGVPRAAQDLLHRQIRQRVQPELLDLVELPRIRVGGVVLVVVVEAEQGEDLVDRLYAGAVLTGAVLAGAVQTGAVQTGAGLIPPRRCR